MNFWLKGNVTIPARPHTVGGLIGWARGVNRALTELRDRKIEGRLPKPTTKSIKPPLWVTLRRPDDDPDAYEVYVEFGHVVPRHNASSDIGAPIEITSLPTKEDPLAVSEDDKLWVKLTIDVEGKCTEAEFESGTTWPEDSPPELIGGNDQSGTEGERYIRIAEIIVDPESTATPAPLIRKQLHTGHIDHFQPELIENTTTSPSGGEARILKEWNTSAGKWDLRYLKDGSGIEITENDDDIEIKMKDGVTNGDMLYWDATGEEWVLLAAPPSGYIHVLSHDGDVPSWIETEECE
jgi:hypothetical protein